MTEKKRETADDLVRRFEERQRFKAARAEETAARSIDVAVAPLTKDGIRILADAMRRAERPGYL